MQRRVLGLVFYVHDCFARQRIYIYINIDAFYMEDNAVTMIPVLNYQTKKIFEIIVSNRFCEQIKKNKLKLYFFIRSEVYL